MKRVFERVGALVLLAALGAAAAATFAWRSLDEPLAVESRLVFKVPPGATLSRVAAQLGSRGVVKYPRVWALYARARGVAGALKAGEYAIEPGTTPRRLLERMVAGDVILHSLTFIDGWRTADALAALRRNPDVQVTLRDPSKDLMAKLGAPGLDPEGQFLPETYRFPAGTTDLELLRQAHAALVQALTAAWATRAPDLPLESPQQLLILASIVEKESGLPSELPRIAGLYLHRLAIGMRLQADPTVIYGLGDRYDGELHSIDLATDGPYNTYTRTGLPPTPIALPSAAVLEASAHPEKTDALYFVASDKDDGSHVFSATLAEHNAAVARYVAHLRRKAASR